MMGRCSWRKEEKFDGEEKQIINEPKNFIYRNWLRSHNFVEFEECGAQRMSRHALHMSELGGRVVVARNWRVKWAMSMMLHRSRPLEAPHGLRESRKRQRTENTVF